MNGEVMFANKQARQDTYAEYIYKIPNELVMKVMLRETMLRVGKQ